MKHLGVKITSLIFVAFVLASGALSASAFEDQNASFIDAFIARQSKRMQGDEYRDARKVVTGDLTRDGVPETVVLYTIEGQGGSNNYTQYLAVFARGKSGLVAVTHTAVGGKLRRSIEQVSVSDNAIQLETLSYGPNDAACCPSIKGTTRSALAGKMLREQNRRAK
jgi:hypothetical protein